METRANACQIRGKHLLFTQSSALLNSSTFRLCRDFSVKYAHCARNTLVAPRAFAAYFFGDFSRTDFIHKKIDKVLLRRSTPRLILCVFLCHIISFNYRIRTNTTTACRQSIYFTIFFLRFLRSSDNNTEHENRTSASAQDFFLFTAFPNACCAFSRSFTAWAIVSAFPCFCTGEKDTQRMIA